MESFSEQQTLSANLAIEAFRRNVLPWVILLAQMQSGKTETYLLIACELIRYRLVENVVIFSGNAEIDLREQLKGQLKDGSRFFEKYIGKRFDDEDHEGSMSRMEYRQLDARLRTEVKEILCKISVVWGSELNSYSGPTTNTLFVWEEAHYAQSREQRPDKFLHSIGVSADGNENCLHQKHNLMMTISATPFSELSDNLLQTQGKYVVKMLPGDGYVSVKAIRDSGRIVPFVNREDGIATALDLPKCGKNWYGIIRLSQNQEEMVKSIIEVKGWKWVVYDSVSTGAERKKGEDNWQSMNQEPAENTVILIRGKCRMGKNLEKKHLLFVFEIANNSNTDTVLQSLLGRTCGYSEGSDRVIVYLSNKIVKSGEIDRYIEMWELDGVKTMPIRANNLTGKKVKAHLPIIPNKLTLPEGLSRTDNAIKNHLISVARNEPHKIISKNSAPASSEILQKIINGGKLKCYNIKPGKKLRNETKARELIDAHERGIAKDFGSGCGIDSEATEINIWVFRTGLPEEFDKNTIYITAHVSREDMEEFNIPATTGREVFATQLEDGTEAVGNGGMTIRLSSHTANNETAMKTELSKMIDISLTTPGCDRKIASCWDDKEKEYKGIIVTPEIYKQLQKGGSIYEHAKREYGGVLLHTCKSSGPVPKELKERGFIKLSSISW